MSEERDHVFEKSFELIKMAEKLIEGLRNNKYDMVVILATEKGEPDIELTHALVGNRMKVAGVLSYADKIAFGLKE